MSYKIKSLLYFISFVAISIIYYSMDPEKEQNTPSKSVETPKEIRDNIKPEEKIIELYETTKQA